MYLPLGDRACSIFDLHLAGSLLLGIVDTLVDIVLLGHWGHLYWLLVACSNISALYTGIHEAFYVFLFLICNNIE